MVTTELPSLPSLRAAPVSIPHRDNGHSPGASGEDRLQTLQRTLELARVEQTIEQIVEPLYELGQCYLEQFKLHEARSHFEEAVGILRTLSSKDQTLSLAKVLGGMASAEYYVGNPEAALAVSTEAENCAVEVGNLSLAGRALCVQAASLCYAGRYQEAQAAFERSRSAYLHAGDTAGIAEQQMWYAREYALDQGLVQEAIDVLERIQATLRESARIEALLALTDGSLRLGNLPRATEWCQQLEDLVLKGKRYWYRPEFYLLKARITAEVPCVDEAIQYARAGLSAAGAYGDLRQLSPLYRELAAYLERDRSHVEDAYDSLERAILAGQVRGRKLDLALAFYAAGSHLKRFANRPTLRARGSGYLFKADILFGEMKLQDPRLPRPATAPLSSEAVH